MNFFHRKKKSNVVSNSWKIKRDCLNLILECAKSNFPKEFGGLLRVDSSSNRTIIEVIILPGTISGDAHAIFKLHMLPIDFSIVGTFHSHPSPSSQPSKADLALFNKFGKIHIITANPFDNYSWKSYDYNGSKINIIVV